MTAILAYTDGKEVWMAGDSASTNGSWDRHILTHRKVWKHGDILTGVSGRYRIAHRLRELFIPPPYRPDEQDAYAYLVSQFTPALDAFLKTTNDSMKASDYPTVLLVGLSGQIFVIDQELTVCDMVPSAQAIGSGADYALGAFLMGRAINDNSSEIEAQMLTALRITSECSLSVAPPFYIEKV